MKAGSQGDVCTSVFTAAPFIVPKGRSKPGAQAKCGTVVTAFLSVTNHVSDGGLVRL